MLRRRLKFDTLAVKVGGEGARETVLIPARSEILVPGLPDDAATSTIMVEVTWNGKPVRMFVYDLLERTEQR